MSTGPLVGRLYPLFRVFSGGHKCTSCCAGVPCHHLLHLESYQLSVFSEGIFGTVEGQG